MNLDPEFKYILQHAIERFMTEQLGVVDNKIIGIPFVTQNIIQLITE
jgi:hypothetical protein